MKKLLSIITISLVALAPFAALASTVRLHAGAQFNAGGYGTLQAPGAMHGSCDRGSGDCPDEILGNARPYGGLAQVWLTAGGHIGPLLIDGSVSLAPGLWPLWRMTAGYRVYDLFLGTGAVVLWFGQEHTLVHRAGQNYTDYRGKHLGTGFRHTFRFLNLFSLYIQPSFDVMRVSEWGADESWAGSHGPEREDGGGSFGRPGYLWRAHLALGALFDVDIW